MAGKDPFHLWRAQPQNGDGRKRSEDAGLRRNGRGCSHQRKQHRDGAAMGIADGMIRLSVGLEDIQDLVEDFGQALGAA